MKQLLPNVPDPPYLKLGKVQYVAVFSIDSSY